MTGRCAAGAIAGLALVAAAAYLLIYLYRWEWHRAVVAGIFLIALEIGLGFGVAIDRLRRLEDRLDATERQTAEQTRAAVHHAALVRQPFAWLSESTDRLSVFVPILLGAGVVLSGLAWIVERVARATAGATLERGLALGLQPLTVPLGTLSGDRSVAAALAPPVVPDDRRGARRIAVFAIGLLLLGFAASATFERLADATQNRPDKVDPTSAGRVVVSIFNRQAPSESVAAVEKLWSACGNQIGTGYRVTGIEYLTAGRIEVRVRPAIGRHAERRLRGCLEDAGLDRIRAKVHEVSAR